MDKIGKKIRQLRTDKKMTMEQLAKKSGITARRLSDIELNGAGLKVSTLSSIALALGTTVDVLLQEGSKTNEKK